MQDFKKLTVWSKAHSLTISVYQSTADFPKDELFGLTSQIRRACASIPSNIAEGCGKEGGVELSRFLQFSLGSTTELEYHLLLARDLKYIKDEKYDELNKQVDEIRKMLITFIQKLRKNS